PNATTEPTTKIKDLEWSRSYRPPGTKNERINMVTANPQPTSPNRNGKNPGPIRAGVPMPYRYAVTANPPQMASITTPDTRSDVLTPRGASSECIGSSRFFVAATHRLSRRRQ